MSGTVGDDEQLYRRVKENIGTQLCYKVEDGKTVFLHAAFNDPNKQPSVDRANLKHRSDPHLSRENASDGIVSLQAEGIRNLGPISKLNAKGKPTKDTFEVDVVADPRFGNCSHALVSMSPSTAGSGAFMRLKEGLVRLANEAGWTVTPDTRLPKRHGYLHELVNFLVLRYRSRL